MDLTVSIVNYNTLDDLRKCLQSIFDYFEGFSFEVIVHDNASSDGSQDMVKKEFPQVILVENESNINFTRAHNKVLDMAKGEFILFFNPDTYFTYNAVKPVLDFIRANSEVGLCSITNKTPDEEIITKPFAKFQTFPQMLVKNTFLNSIPFLKKIGLVKSFPISENQKHVESEVIGGAFQLIRTELVKKINGFDTDILIYFSDDDISYRVLQEGYKNVVILDEFYYHKRLGTAKSVGLKKVNYFIKHDAVVYTKKYFGKTRAIILFILIKITNLLASIIKHQQVKVPEYKKTND